MSPSTYSTSEYSGFFVPVDAQSGRCTRAPSAARRSHGGPAALQPCYVGQGNLLVGLHVEEQRHVDVDPARHEFLDGRGALWCSRDLDHNIRAGEPAEEVARLPNGAG